MNAVTNLEEEVRTSTVVHFSPDDYLINTLRRATANQQDIQLEIEGAGRLLLLSSRGEYFFNSGDLSELLSSAPQRCKLSILEPDDRRIPKSGTVGRNIDELMWHAAFHVSRGRLMQGCHFDDVVELEYWPNLTRLPHTPNTMRIAALLARHPTSIFFATRLLKIESSEMYQFYSAARAAGFARAVNRKPEEPKLEPHRNQTLLASLLKKIAGM